MANHHQSLEDAEPALLWFSRLETARQRRDPRLIDRAVRELEGLGVVVRFVRPIRPASDDEERGR